MTKYLPSLIISTRIRLVNAQGGQVASLVLTHREECTAMRIMVYPLKEGVLEVTVVPGRRAKLPPVTMRGKNRDTVMVEVLATVREIHGKLGYPEG